MTIDEAIQSKIEALPVNKRRDVLHFIEKLTDAHGRQPLPNPRGRLRVAVDLSLEDFQQIRREAWGEREGRP